MPRGRAQPADRSLHRVKLKKSSAFLLPAAFPNQQADARQEAVHPLLAKIDAERQALAPAVLPKFAGPRAVQYPTNQ